MTANDICDCEDIAEAVREGRAVRPARAFRIQIANGDLNFRSVTLSDAIPTGRQILAGAGLDTANGFSLFAVLPDGDFEDIRLDEPFDLRNRGAERFVAFQSDRLFRLTVADRQIEWGKPLISGRTLYKLGEVAKGEALFLKSSGADRLVEPDEVLDLGGPEIEHFVKGPKPVQTYEIKINGRTRTVNDETVTFEQVVALAFPGPHGPNIVFSMTYRHASSKPHAGELGPGGSVEVKKKGTIFNVTKTDKS